MSNTPTPEDTTAITVAEQAYEIVRIARIAQGAEDLPTWADVSETYLFNHLFNHLLNRGLILS